MMNLPETCYSILSGTGELIIIRRGESGYYRTNCSSSNKSENIELKDFYNERLGITKIQEECMKVGSMFGWNVPGANPDNFDENGRFIMKEEA